VSIFDAIRYPISDPPTEEQIRDIPIRVFRKWRKMSSWYRYEDNYESIIDYYTHKNYAGIPSEENDYLIDMKLLKGMILRLRK
jgi:hypothetical protein